MPEDSLGIGKCTSPLCNMGLQEAIECKYEYCLGKAMGKHSHCRPCDEVLEIPAPDELVIVNE